MIKAVFYLSSKHYRGFDICGHADWADEGKDIVCASVSSAVLLTCNTVTDFFKADSAASCKGNKIRLRINKPDDRTDALLRSLRVHLRNLGKEYGNTITITLSEV